MGKDILSAYQIADFILRDMWRLQPKDVSRRLLERGVAKKDISLAFKFALPIAFLDEQIFGSGNGAKMTFALRPVNFFTGYAHLSDGQEESYYVFVNGLYRQLRQERKYRRIFLLDKEGNRVCNEYKQEPRPSLASILLTTAVHEVRHRLQNKEKIDMFSPADAYRLDNPYIKSFIRYRMILFMEKAVVWRKQKKQADYIESETSPKEFDAGLIEHIASSELYRGGMTIERLIRITRLQPHN